MFIHFLKGETYREHWVGDWQRERETQSEQARLWVVSTEPDSGLKLMICKIMTWPEVVRSTDWATQVPHKKTKTKTKKTKKFLFKFQQQKKNFLNIFYSEYVIFSQ